MKKLTHEEMAILFNEFTNIFHTKWNNIDEFLADENSRIEFQMYGELLFQVSFFDDDEGPELFLEEEYSTILKMLNEDFKKEYKTIYHLIARFIDGEDIIEDTPESVIKYGVGEGYLKTKIFLEDIFNEKSLNAFFRA